MGLNPTSLDGWITINPKNEILDHKKQLLVEKYSTVIARTEKSLAGQKALAEFTGLKNISTYPDSIANVASQIAEDVCIIDTSDGNRFVAGCVCSPSYWDLNKKIGQPLWNIHETVDGLNSFLGENIDRFITGLTYARPFKRENWFIHGDTERLHLSPEEDLNNEPSSWFIRTERETLCRIHEDFIVFTINPRFVPLNSILDYPEALNSLKTVLNGFTEDEITYFGGRKKFAQLTNFLESDSTNA